MPSVSAIVLTKDSERTIEVCVKALKPAVDHVIVVDTGSSDNTVQIAKDCGARVYHFEWRDDFSAARNFGDTLATSDWVIQVDSDEILRDEDAGEIRKLCARYKKTKAPVAININKLNDMGDHIEVSPSARLYKRGTLVWKGIIHEQLYSRRGEQWHVIPSDIGVLHDGYNPEIIDIPAKVRRNIELLQRGLEKEPNNSVYLYFIGRDYTVIDDYESAIPYLERSVELIPHQHTNANTVLDHARSLLAGCMEKVSQSV